MSDTAPAAEKRGFVEVWRSYANWRTVLMLFLGFSAGLPFLLVFSTLSAWLTEAGVSRTEIGLFSYVGLVYTLKFVWAPFMDRIRLPVIGPLLGRRRSWMLLAQAGIALGLVGIAYSDPSTNLTVTALCALAVAFCSATQDIAVDAWRIEAAPDERQGAMAATYQLGYRLAIIASGAGALYIADFVSWKAAYFAMAATMGVGMVTTLLSPRVGDETPSANTHKGPRDGEGLGAWLYGLIVAPIADFVRRYGPEAIAILALIGLFRVPDFVMGVMANPFYLDLGYTKSEIATVVKLYGVWLAIVGAFTGGVVIARLGVVATLWIGVLAASATNLVYVWLAHQNAELGALAVAISAENFAGGFAGTVLIAYMSSLTSTAFTATQYALFSSFYALPGKWLGGTSGLIVDSYGYPALFVSTALMGVPALILALVIWHWHRSGTLATGPQKAAAE